MKTKHTPGPWEVVQLQPQGSIGFVIRVQGKDHGICGCGNYEHTHPAGSFTDKECQANARLIAAAPDLLKACEAAELILDCLGPESSSFESLEALSLLHAAISKAKGQPPCP